MALISRLSRLFQADFHAVLDRIEEPDTLLRQAVRDMEDALSHDTQQIKILQSDQSQIQSRLDDVQATAARLDEELDVCFTAGQDHLAKGVVKRQLETRKLGALLARKKSTLAEDLGSLEKRVAENRDRLEAMRQKAEMLADTEPAAGSFDTTPDVSVRDDEVDVAFLREKQKRSAS